MMIHMEVQGCSLAVVAGEIIINATMVGCLVKKMVEKVDCLMHPHL